MDKKIIDGKLVSEKIRGQIKDHVDELKNQTSAVPGLAAVLVGEDGPSQIYVRNKRKACENVGIYSEEHKLPENTTENHLLSLINKLNNQENINGILIQLPLPDHIDETKILNSVNPDKDVDGFHPENAGLLSIGKPRFIPCTPKGIMEILKYFICLQKL